MGEFDPQRATSPIASRENQAHSAVTGVIVGLLMAELWQPEIKEIHELIFSFIVASGISRGRVRTTMVESRNMVAILKITG